MNIESLVSALKPITGTSFVSVTYTAKNTGETARYVLRVGSSYVNALEKDLTEIDIRLGNAHGIEKAALLALRNTIQTSINSHLAGEEHPDYTKRDMYQHLNVPGLKLFTKDCTLEIQGFQHSRAILIPGVYPNVKSSELVLAKNKIRKDLNIGKFRSLCVDTGNIHSVRANGETVEFE